MFFYTLTGTIANGYKFEWLVVLALIAVILAILTIVTKSPIYSVLYLIGLFLTISLYLIGSNLPFMGISYILVYVGAVSILFLFILMLINVRISELLTEGRNSAILSILVVLIFTATFNTKLPYSINLYEQLTNIRHYMEINENNTFIYNTNITAISKLENYDISIVSSYSWDNSLMEISHISSIGNILYTVQLISLIIVGIILLLSIIGCIVTTVKPKDNIDNINTNMSSPDYVNMSL